MKTSKKKNVDMSYERGKLAKIGERKLENK